MSDCTPNLTKEGGLNFHGRTQRKRPKRLQAPEPEDESQVVKRVPGAFLAWAAKPHFSMDAVFLPLLGMPQLHHRTEHTPYQPQWAVTRMGCSWGWHPTKKKICLFRKSALFGNDIIILAQVLRRGDTVHTASA